MFCTNCGKESDAGAQFCGGCGNNLSVQKTDPQKSESKTQPIGLQESIKRNGCSSSIFVAVCLGFGLIVGLILGAILARVIDGAGGPDEAIAIAVVLSCGLIGTAAGGFLSWRVVR